MSDKNDMVELKQENVPPGFNSAPCPPIVRVMVLPGEPLAGLVFLDEDGRCVYRYGPMDRDELKRTIHALDGALKAIEAGDNK